MILVDPSLTEKKGGLFREDAVDQCVVFEIVGLIHQTARSFQVMIKNIQD